MALFPQVTPRRRSVSACAARLITALFLVGCVAPGPDISLSDVGSTSEAIVGGTSGGDPAVVILQNFRSGGLCTGTLIAERVVLTAKHCVQPAFADGPVPPNDIVVGVGDSASGVTSVLRVQSITATPGPYTQNSRGGINNDLIGVDVAVMILQTGAAGVTPIPVRRISHTSLGGQIITATGFGQTPSGEVGVKYTAMGRITGTDSRLLYTGALTCQGDSGGPAITSDNEVAGVVSFGSGACGSGFGAYNAIFPFLGMIDDALTEAGSCLNDGAERCDGADNDCDDLVDETCTELGGTCRVDNECVGLTCRETGVGMICTSPCDPLRPSFGCNPGSYCQRTGGCEGHCVPMTGAADQPNGAACTNDGECASLYCSDPGDGRQRCLVPCRGDEGMCIADEACAAPTGQCGGCVDAAIVIGSRGVGEGCEEDTDCGSMMCLEDAGRMYCTRACNGDSECPSGYHCRDGMVCVSGPRGDLGDRCVVNGDCGDMLFCAARAADRWCTRLCGVSDPCPEGFDCVEAAGTTVCAPNRGLVGDACNSNADCVTELCISGGETGSVCSRLCGADAPCAPGYECRRTDDGVTAVCVAPAGETGGGGCSVGHRQSRTATLMTGLGFVGLLLLVFVRRKRRL